ncbi:hypothetical protein EG340_03720 [Chryseobacterium indoltheticum]|uniref:Uncharacterized protein n=1 Tax=Chryseobacterium indoltheticum TaxID=254 RepID=A0A3G6N5A6_9FLAO|nr:hypothetical protein EG340_03720 [Chryseobacterium indoltheticum]
MTNVGYQNQKNPFLFIKLNILDQQKLLVGQHLFSNLLTRLLKKQDVIGRQPQDIKVLDIGGWHSII